MNKKNFGTLALKARDGSEQYYTLFQYGQTLMVQREYCGMQAVAQLGKDNRKLVIRYLFSLGFIGQLKGTDEKTYKGLR